MSVFGFNERLEFSRGIRLSSDVSTIKAMIPGCVAVVKTDEKQDRAGIDYIATLRHGAEILIDSKARDFGCSRWWKNGPDLALEVWSVVPGGKYKIPEEKAKWGWAFNEKSNVDAIYFSFDPRDTTTVFLIPFQPLRAAFRKFYKIWKDAGYRIDVQETKEGNSGWQSQCMFVPAKELRKAINAICEGRLVETC